MIVSDQPKARIHQLLTKEPVFETYHNVYGVGVTFAFGARSLLFSSPTKVCWWFAHGALTIMYNVYQYDLQIGFGAFLLTYLCTRMRLSSSYQIALVCLATCSLTVSLATRFTIPVSETPGITSVQTYSPHAHRQQLLGDGLKWTAPASSFKVFEPPRALVYAVPAVFPSTTFYSETWLYDRPPPHS